MNFHCKISQAKAKLKLFVNPFSLPCLEETYSAHMHRAFQRLRGPFEPHPPCGLARGWKWPRLSCTAWCLLCGRLSPSHTGAPAMKFGLGNGTTLRPRTSDCPGTFWGANQGKEAMFGLVSICQDSCPSAGLPPSDTSAQPDGPLRSARPASPLLCQISLNLGTPMLLVTIVQPQHFLLLRLMEGRCRFEG